MLVLLFLWLLLLVVVVFVVASRISILQDDRPSDLVNWSAQWSTSQWHGRHSNCLAQCASLLVVVCVVDVVARLFVVVLIYDGSERVSLTAGVSRDGRSHECPRIICS